MTNLNRNNIDVHNLVKKIVRKSRDDGSADNITVSIIKLKDINNKSYKKIYGYGLKILKN